MHGQNERRTQSLDGSAHALSPHGQPAVHRHHDDVEAADFGEMGVGEFVMQVAEMTDAKTRDLEDEDRIPIGFKGAAPAADIGRHVADIGVPDDDAVLDLLARCHVVPAVQDGRDRRIGRQRVMARMRLVHRHHIRQLRRAQPAIEIGGDADAAWRFDLERRMAEKADRHRLVERGQLWLQRFGLEHGKAGRRKSFGDQLALADRRPVLPGGVGREHHHCANRQEQSQQHGPLPHHVRTGEACGRRW